ncbi:MAG TPA: hypothetical protein PLC99_19365 [Verrucomicrobiota bacterium]|nr:hypothetical protein [Verrucomicrobiota bacterium]
MKMSKSRRSYPAEHMTSGSQFERTDPDYADHRLQHMRAEYRSLPRAWRPAYLAGLGKKDAEALLGRRSEP